MRVDDEQLAEVIGLLLFNLSSSEVRQHVLYKASVLEAMGAFEKAKRVPGYKPLDDEHVRAVLFDRVEPMALSFVPDGMTVNVRRRRRR